MAIESKSRKKERTFNESQKFVYATNIKDDLVLRGYILDSQNESTAYWSTDKLILKDVRRASDGRPVHIRVICGDNADKRAEASYSVRKMINTRENLEQLVHDDPQIFGGFKAVVAERADDTLSNYFESREFIHMPLGEQEDTLFRIVLQTSYGIKKVHKQGIIHRDIKESNILFYKKLINAGWGLGDFEFSSIGDLRNGGSQATYTAHQHNDYLPYEIKEIVDDKEAEKVFNFSTDIFSLGVVWYKGLDVDSHTPLTRCTKEHKNFTPKWTMTNIDASEYSPRTKYIMKRMLGVLPPGGIDNGKDRYVNIDDLIYDMEHWDKTTNSVKRNNGDRTIINTDTLKQNYKQYLKEMAEFEILFELEQNKRDKNGLVNNKSINDIVTAYEKLIKSYETKKLDKMIDAQTTKTQLESKYVAFATEQGAIIKRISKEITARNIANSTDIQKSAQDHYELRQKTGLWGPPVTLIRYNLDQTNGKDNHYYADYASYLKK